MSNNLNDIDNVSSDDETVSNKKAMKKQFKLFKNQVAGHFPILYHHGAVYKPAPDSEIEFYQNIPKLLPEIMPFIPFFHGVEHLSRSNFPEKIRKENLNAPASALNINDCEPWSKFCYNKQIERIKNMPFLVLEDLTHPFVKPCVLDLKIGIRHYSAICDTNKKRRKLKKAWKSTNRTFGVRLGGMQTFNNTTKKYEWTDKYAGMRLSPDGFCRKLVKFFRNHDNKIRLTLVEEMLKKLDKLMNILKQEMRYRWFSCSLLLIYEGMKMTSYSSGTVTPPSCPQKSLKLNSLKFSALECSYNENLAKQCYQKVCKLKEANIKSFDNNNNNNNGGFASDSDSKINISEEKENNKLYQIYSNDDENVGQILSSMNKHEKRFSCDVTNANTPKNVILPKKYNDILEHEGDFENEEDFEEDDDDDTQSDDNAGSVMQFQRSQITRKQQANCYSQNLGGIQLQPSRFDIRLIDFSNFVNINEHICELDECKNNAYEMQQNNVQEEEEEEATCEERNKIKRLQLHKDLDNLNEPDYGILFALQSLVTLLTELKETKTIRARSKNGWLAFRNNIMYSSKAVLPFDEFDFENDSTPLYKTDTGVACSSNRQ